MYHENGGASRHRRRLALYVSAETYLFCVVLFVPSLRSLITVFFVTATVGQLSAGELWLLDAMRA
jgi:hypothetical protein